MIIPIHIISRILINHDPKGLLKSGEPKDEYLIEATAIGEKLDKVQSEKELRHLIETVFIEYFERPTIFERFQLRKITKNIYSEIKRISIKVPCPVCGHKTLDKRGIYRICDVCFWEDEGDIQNEDEPTHGPNGDLSLVQARVNYKKIGVVKERFLEKQKPPL